jgi:hypothetical protein
LVKQTGKYGSGRAPQAKFMRNMSSKTWKSWSWKERQGSYRHFYENEFNVIHFSRCPFKYCVYEEQREAVRNYGNSDNGGLNQWMH